MYTTKGMGYVLLRDEWEELRQAALHTELRTTCGSMIVPFDASRFQWLWNYFHPIYACQLVGLWPSQQIVSHQDEAIAGVRHHLPLQTNPGCWSFHAGTWQQLEVGRIYQMDPTKPHGAVNWGSEIRLHLIIDTTDT
jgi:hypothetical protein